MIQTNIVSPAPPAPFVLNVRLRAEAYIAAVRSCGLVIFPWDGRRKESDRRGWVGICGRDVDGPNDYDAGTLRLLSHPDGRANKDCPPGLIFEVLCAEFGVDPDDPDLCRKVHDRLSRDARVVS